MLKKSLKFLQWRKVISRNYTTNLESCDCIHGCPTKFVNTLDMLDVPVDVPAYRLLDPEGNLLDPSFTNHKDITLKMYKSMAILRELESILNECQRQGRISFHMTCHGEEASVIGSSAGLDNSDLAFPQYREAGILLWRGYTILQFVNQCFGNIADTQKGRQMPIHYGSRELNVVTVSSPIAVQIPHAVGAAYSFKMAENGRCTITYFGDGATSEGDTHAAFNFAATLQCPVIFFCRNNGFAISTPVSEQFKVSAICARAAGYGMRAMKVDGNDILAVYNATKKAREYVLKYNEPILIEAMTYRKGHHSTSDDSFAYRSKDEVDKWDSLDPIKRLKRFITQQLWWNDEEDELLKNNTKRTVLDSISKAEKLKKPKWSTMFDDVYDELPENLKEQKRYMQNHLKNYGQYYPLKEFEQEDS